MSATDGPLDRNAHTAMAPDPLEKVDGWSIWPVQDGIHMASRDEPLNDREQRTLTMSQSVFADTRIGLLEKIAKQNRMAAELGERAR